MRQHERVSRRGLVAARGIAACIGLLAIIGSALFVGGQGTGARLWIDPSFSDLSVGERFGQVTAVSARLVLVGCAAWLLIAVIEQTIAAWRGRPPSQQRRGRFGAVAAAIVLTGAGPAPTSGSTAATSNDSAHAQTSADAQEAAADAGTVTLTPVQVPGSVTQTATTQPTDGRGTRGATSASDVQLSHAVAACGPTIDVTAQTDIRAEALDYLGEALGREPTDAEADEYWNRCVLANQASLPDPAEPEVVAPGTVIVLPEATEMPRTL